ncbi:hypothetical protein [Saccharopolyspora spinosa]|uniref:Alpha amylase inhibitor n=1 Tax=Saccharopolyspora spinosa TaxID=60894 RepID=A0A2N3XT40_SACSN|nr:hypothetical protein [Saccharopolyspora spinosa]PKW13833.1 hypothetical protein A8926_1397 [Saccharopolyspora spinosa]
MMLLGVPGAATAEGDDVDVASPPAPGCMTWRVVKKIPPLYTTFRIHNGCVAPYTVRLDIAYAPDTACVRVDPFRFVDQDNDWNYGEPSIQGVVLCE